MSMVYILLEYIMISNFFSDNFFSIDRKFIIVRFFLEKKRMNITVTAN